MARSNLVKCLALLALGLASLSRAGEEPTVWEPQLAGSWYPAGSAALEKMLDGFLAEGAKKAKGVEGRPIALIAPHAGYQFCGRCAGAVFATVKGKPYRRVVLLAFSHRGIPPRGVSVLDVDAFATPLGNVPVDREACATLLRNPRFRNVPAAYAGENSFELLLPFLRRAIASFHLVPVILGRLEESDFAPVAETLRKVIDDETLVAVSSDFTHYGIRFDHTPFTTDIRANVEKQDKGAVALILKRDPAGFAKYLEETRATICGATAIRVLLHLLPEKATGQLVDYYTSGDEAGRHDDCVAYAGVVLTAPGQWGTPPPKPGEKGAEKPAAEVRDAPISEAGQKKLLDIARKTLVAVTDGKDAPELKLDDAELQGRNGVFVTLNKNGELRGCMGNFKPATPLYHTVAAQARQSALEDPRFPAVRPIEVGDIDIEISVLMPEKPIKDPLDWEFGKHGIIVRRDWQQATYLPQVAEQFKSKEEMLSSCCRKAGMLSAMWRDPATTVLIYTAQVFGEKPPAKEKAK